MGTGGMSTSSGIAVSGLRAQWRRLDALANNIANARTTRSADGEAYRRKDIVFSEVGEPCGGVRTEVFEDPSAYRLEHDPKHPDARADGMVEMPNVDLAEEQVNLMYTQQAFLVNLAVLRTDQQMHEAFLDILR